MERRGKQTSPSGAKDQLSRTHLNPKSDLRARGLLPLEDVDEQSGCCDEPEGVELPTLHIRSLRSEVRGPEV